MINFEKLAPIIEGYKEYFPEHFKDEQYKWEAVKHFQDNWNINAEDFGAMFKKATEKAGNLLGSAHSYPRGMILEFAKADNEAVRQMFIHLYDENTDLAERIEAFVNTSEELRIKYNDGTWNNHYQDTHAISVYLWLRYPDKYYIYKYEIYRNVANELDSDFQPKRRYTPNNIVGGYAMYDEICSVLQTDKDIREMLNDALTESCHPDTKLKTLSGDFGFYLCRFYLDDKKKETEKLSINDVELDDDIEQKMLSILPDDDIPVINTWLLTWNPTKWDWTDYHQAIVETVFGKGYITNWNCYNHNTRIGDRVFLAKLGDSSTPKGIIASGYIISDPYQDDNYDASKSTKLNYVDIILTEILDYIADNILTLEQLTSSFPQQKWNPQSSGIIIKPEAAKWLIENWDSFQNKHNNDIESEWEDWNESENEPVIWKISHGTPSTSGISKELRKILEERKAVIVNQYTSASIGQKTSQGDEYMYNIKAGDYFYLCYAGEIVLFGQFLDAPIIMNQEMYDKWGDDGWQERKYQLIALSNDHNKYTGKKKIWTSNYNSTCVKVTDNALFEELILEPYFGLKLSDLKKDEYHEPYTKEDFLKDVFITEPEYDKLHSIVLRKKNIILQGAPGVGKTYSAKRLAWSIMGEKNNDRICMVQFHQSYSYEDFIMGYRPNEDGGFDLQEGVFYSFCEKAKDPANDYDYYFIIDEINRGNLSKIFGELLMLIESDKRGEDHKINLIYGNKPFYIPDNLYIIGMMNTADRSLAMIDYALRRRFSFYTMHPAFEKADENGFAEYTKNIDCPLYHNVIEKIKELNKAIKEDSALGKGFEIGHSYFVPEDISVIDDEWVKNVIEYEIIPLIEEYWFDNEDEKTKWKEKLYQTIGEPYDE